jgi:hypothetical protein
MIDRRRVVVEIFRCHQPGQISVLLSKMAE